MASSSMEIKLRLLEDLKKQNAEMDEKLGKLGLKDLVNLQEVQEASKILQKWGAKQLDQCSILASANKYYLEDSKKFMTYRALKMEEQRLNDKSQNVKNMCKKIERSNSIFRKELKSCMNGLEKPLKMEQLEEISSDSSEDPHESLAALMGEWTEKQEELSLAKEKSGKYLDLPRSKEELRAKHDEAKRVAELKKIELKQHIQKLFH